MGNHISRRNNIIVPLSENSTEGVPLEGKGKYVTTDGCCYIGKFSEGSFNGKGDFKYPDGSIYSGDWLAHNRHGKGTLKYPTGEEYYGDFLYDEIHGWGKITYSSGDYYEGQFLFGCQNGIGTYYSIEGKKVYQGQWYNNLFHGNGLYYHDNGRKMYDGNWKNGLAHGYGILYDQFGKKIYKGIFIDGFMQNKHSNSSQSSITDSPILTSVQNHLDVDQYQTDKPATNEQKEDAKKKLLYNPLVNVRRNNCFENIFKPVVINDTNDKVSFSPLRIAKKTSFNNSSPPFSFNQSTNMLPPLVLPPTAIENPFNKLKIDDNHPFSMQHGHLDKIIEEGGEVLNPIRNI
jgi:hypothetical protein